MNVLERNFGKLYDAASKVVDNADEFNIPEPDDVEALAQEILTLRSKYNFSGAFSGDALPAYMMRMSEESDGEAEEGDYEKELAEVAKALGVDLRPKKDDSRRSGPEGTP